jgi:cell wall-associated NlpC family hydrolase
MRNILYVFAWLSSMYLFTLEKKIPNIKEKTMEPQEVKITELLPTDALLLLAQSKIGSPYEHGKTGPQSFDCSGFVYYLFNEHNISIPRTSIDQSKIGKKLDKSKIRKGDILFFDTSEKGHVNHSGVYLGEDKFIHASSGKAKGVTISDLNTWYVDKFMWGIRKQK